MTILLVLDMAPLWAHASAEQALRRLDVLVGTWSIEGKIRAGDGSETKTMGTTEVGWTLDNRWLRLQSRAAASGQPPYAVSVFVAWNEASRAYEAVALNNQRTAPVVYVGNWIGSRLTFTGRIGEVVQRVDYDVRDGRIDFTAADSFDGGRTFITHATATWRRSQTTRAR